MTDDWLDAAAKFRAQPTKSKNWTPPWQYRRRCSVCGQSRLLAGGAGAGRNWICRTCRPRPAKAA